MRRNPDDHDWAAVAKTIADQMFIVGLNEAKLAKQSNVSKQMVREILDNSTQRNRRSATLESLSRALNLHPQHLAYVSVGKEPPQLNDSVDAGRLAAVERILIDVVERLDEVNAKVTKLLDSSWQNHPQ